MGYQEAPWAAASHIPAVTAVQLLQHPRRLRVDHPLLIAHKAPLSREEVDHFVDAALAAPGTDQAHPPTEDFIRRADAVLADLAAEQTTLRVDAPAVPFIPTWKVWCPDDGDEPAEPNMAGAYHAIHAAETWVEQNHANLDYAETVEVAVRDPAGALHRLQVNVMDVPSYSAVELT